MGMTGQQFAEKWGRRMNAAGQDMRNGVEGVTEAPGQRAAKKADKMREGILRALADGTWQRAVAAVSLEDWKRMMIDKGIPRVSAGVNAATGKMAVMGEKLMANLATIAQTVDKMPDNTFEERIAKMVKQSELAHKMKLK